MKNFIKNLRSHQIRKIAKAIGITMLISTCLAIVFCFILVGRVEADLPFTAPFWVMTAFCVVHVLSAIFGHFLLDTVENYLEIRYEEVESKEEEKLVEHWALGFEIFRSELRNFIVL